MKNEASRRGSDAYKKSNPSALHGDSIEHAHKQSPTTVKPHCHMGLYVYKMSNPTLTHSDGQACYVMYLMVKMVM